MPGPARQAPRRAGPGRIQLLAGPRQVGKTTLLLELADQFGKQAIYAAADAPRQRCRGSGSGSSAGPRRSPRPRAAVVFLDEAHLLHDWAARLKGITDRFRRRRGPGSRRGDRLVRARLAAGSRETLAGRFERLTLTHWSAASLQRPSSSRPRRRPTSSCAWARTPAPSPARRHDPVVGLRSGFHPRAGHRARHPRPLGGAAPALLRQVFGVAASSPAQIVSLQKIQGQLQDPGALETIAHYLPCSKRRSWSHRFRSTQSEPRGSGRPHPSWSP